MITDISDVTVQMVRAALDRASVKHLVIAHNLANANSNQYVPVRTSFDQLLDVHKNKLDRVSSVGVVADQSDARASNRVNLDAEIAELSQNVVHYQALLRGLSTKMRILDLAISEGRR